MFSIILLFGVITASAKEFHMKITENGETFTEKLIVNVQENTEEIQVPHHQNSAAVTILNDFNIGLSAAKIPNSRKCFISKIAKSQQRPEDLEKSLEKVGSKFPSERYLVQEFDVITVRKMGKEEVGNKISEFCYGYDLLYTMRLDNENIEEQVLKMVTAAKKKRHHSKHRRDILLWSFSSCSSNSGDVLVRCPMSKLKIRCNFHKASQSYFTYSVTCHTEPQGFKCTGNHQANLLKCCDFICLC